MLQRVLLAAVAAAVLCQVAFPPQVGLADNGDFPRVIGRFQLGSDIQEYNDRFFRYFIPRYRFDPAFSWDMGFLSSQLLLVRASMLLNKAFSTNGWFELRWLALVYLAVLLGVTWLLLRYAQKLSRRARRVTIYGLVLLVLTDVGYVAYFNSFYSEPASYVFCLAAFAAALLLIETPSPPLPLLGLWAAAALLFITAKPQNAPLGVIIAAYSARLVWLRAEHRYRVATAAAMAAAILVASATYYAATPRSTIVMATQYIAVFREILGHSPAPEKDLTELGLSPELKQYAGTHPYMPTVPFYSPELRKAFFDHMNFGKILGFYARHPGRLWDLLNRCAKKALWLRPTLGNFEKSAGFEPYALSKRFDWWSRIHQSVFPATIRGLLLFFGVYVTVAAVLYQRRPAVRDRMYLELLGALIAMAWVQFLVVAIGQGTIDTAKHMFLFALLFDLVLAMGLVWLAGFAAQPLQRFRSARPTR